MSIKFLVLGGGGGILVWGGGKCRFYFYGRGDFSEPRKDSVSAPNCKSQVASDLESQNPNRRNFPQITASRSSDRRSKSRNL